MKSYLGIDCGSVSIKMVLVNDGKVSSKVYLKNTGLVETVREGLRHLPLSGIDGVGVTGSGKEFVKVLVGADWVDSEIIAHMISCLEQYPNVKTILDIGGEDSKLMLMRDGVLTAFQMNRDCGGGTGAMIEAIATRLQVPIEDVGRIALESKNPADLPGKCGIFCQSAVVSELNKGRPVEDILMGVCRALVGNYLAVLAKGKRLLTPVVFQGATALNEALVRCFADALKVDILVPHDCSYMGAIGIAQLTQENMNGDTKFRGDAIISSNYRTTIKNCDGCENRCELLRLFSGRKLLGISGSRCGKWDKGT